MAVNDSNNNGKIVINETEFLVYDDGEIQSKLDQLEVEINQLETQNHTHTNHTILDKIGQTGLETSFDLSKLSAHDASISELSSSSHSHPNQVILDRLGISPANHLTIDGEEQPTENYIHPETHPANMIEEDEEHRFVTDEEKASWNAKADASHQHSLSDLGDVELGISTIAEGDVLTFSQGKWRAETPTTGDATFTLEDYSVNDHVDFAVPLDVIELQTRSITKTSVSLYWRQNPRASEQQSYLIFIGEELIGETEQTNYEVTNLSSSTDYTILVKTKNQEDQISNGRELVTRTQGNVALSLKGGSDYVETPQLSFAAMEIVCLLIPKINSWSNYLIEGASSGIQIYTQHNGGSYRRRGCELYVNGRYEPSTSYAMIPSNERVTIRIEGVEESVITDRFNLFASMSNSTTMQGLLFRVRLYEKNGSGDLILKSDYDFTNGTPDQRITDILGHSPALYVHGSSFIEI
jgi:hypothetical protein